jgi:hypothetical protein
MSIWFVISVIVLIAGTIVMVAILRKRAAASGRVGRPPVLVVGRIVGIAYAAIALIGTVVTVVVTLVNDSIAVALPVHEFWPGKYPWITMSPTPAASVVGGGFTRADVTVTGLGTDARLLLATGHAIQGVTVVLIAVVIALLCHRLLGGTPFRPILARSITVTAVAISAGGIAWQVFFGLGGMAASAQTLGTTGWDSKVPSIEIADYLDSVLEPSATGLPDPYLGMGIDFWPLFLGLALAALAIAFRYSERLQRDTEGLV